MSFRTPWRWTLSKVHGLLEFLKNKEKPVAGVDDVNSRVAYMLYGNYNDSLINFRIYS